MWRIILAHFCSFLWRIRNHMQLTQNMLERVGVAGRMIHASYSRRAEMIFLDHRTARNCNREGWALGRGYKMAFINQALGRSLEIPAPFQGYCRATTHRAAPFYLVSFLWLLKKSATRNRLEIFLLSALLSCLFFERCRLIFTVESVEPDPAALCLHFTVFFVKFEFELLRPLTVKSQSFAVKADTF